MKTCASLLMVFLQVALAGAADKAMELPNNEAIAIIEQHWQTSRGNFFGIPLGKVTIVNGFVNRNPARGKFSSKDLSAFKAWQAVGLVQIREEEKWAKMRNGEFTGWGDWLKATQEGVGSEIIITLTARGEQLNVSDKNESFFFRIGKFEIKEITSNEQLQKDFNRYCLLTGFHQAHITPEYIEWLKQLRKVIPSANRKFRALFAFDKFTSQWKLITVDNADAEGAFRVNTVQSAIQAGRIDPLRPKPAPAISDSDSDGSPITDPPDDVTTTLPDVTSKYYTTENPYYTAGFEGQCTHFAWGRAYEKMGTKLIFNGKSYPSAINWYTMKPLDTLGGGVDKTVKADCIAVWGGDAANPHGHVAYVENVVNSVVHYNEANVTNFKEGNIGGGYHGKEESMELEAFENRGKGVGRILGYIHLNSQPQVMTEEQKKSRMKELAAKGISLLSETERGRLLQLHVIPADKLTKAQRAERIKFSEKMLSLLPEAELKELTELREDMRRKQ